MKVSKVLADEQAREKTAPKMPDIDLDAGKFIQQKHGAYEIAQIQCTGDYVAIAPFQRSKLTEGGIIVPDQANVKPDTGLIVGFGENVGNLSVGQYVKFIPKHKAADLTGEFPFYGKVEIAVYKLASIIAILPQLPVRQV